MSRPDAAAIQQLSRAATTKDSTFETVYVLEPSAEVNG